MFRYQNRRTHADKQVQAWYDEVAKLEAQIGTIETKIQERLNHLAAQASANDPVVQDFIRKMESWDNGSHPYLIMVQNAQAEAAEQRQREQERRELAEKQLAAKGEYIERLNRTLPY